MDHSSTGIIPATPTCRKHKRLAIVKSSTFFGRVKKAPFDLQSTALAKRLDSKSPTYLFVISSFGSEALLQEASDLRKVGHVRSTSPIYIFQSQSHFVVEVTKPAS